MRRAGTGSERAPSQLLRSTCGLNYFEIPTGKIEQDSIVRWSASNADRHFHKTRHGEQTVNKIMNNIPKQRTNTHTWSKVDEAQDDMATRCPRACAAVHLDAAFKISWFKTNSLLHTTRFAKR